MGKRGFALLLTLALIVGCFGAAIAKGPGGPDLYKKNCQICHSKGGEAKVLKLDSLDNDQWKVYMAQPSKIPCYNKWNPKLKDKDIKEIIASLIIGPHGSAAPAKAK